jgi:hypothetical protein
MVAVLAAFFTLIAAARASPIESTFKTICSIPNTTTHYVSSPDTRGTLDILWTSLFTIIACTLTVQHLNVPEQREGRDPGWRGDLKWTLKDTWKSLKWMLVTIIAPELLVAKGLEDIQNARLRHASLMRFAEEDGVPWSWTHTFLANMGGFAIRRRHEEHSQPTSKVGNITSSAIHSENTRIPSVSGTISYVPPNPCHIIASGIIFLRQTGHLPRLPYVNEDEINDKSKSNRFIKAIAVTQIMWTIMQILVRTKRNLAVTQLEIAVLAFSVCAIIVYFINWRKPKDVRTPYTLITSPGPILNDVVDALSVHYKVEGSLFTGLRLNFKRTRFGDPIPNDFGERVDENPLSQNARSYLLAGFFIGSLVFGGIHITAWNFSFPTGLELILWRVASIWCTTFVLFTVLAIPASLCAFYILGWDEEPWISPFIIFLTASYIIGRLILLVEIFRTLFFLPPSAFIATSASNIPHVS